MRLGESLLKDGKITQDELKFCLDVHKNNPADRLGQVVEYYGLVRGIDIARFNAEKVGWALFEGEYKPDWDVIKKVGLEFFQEKRIYPLAAEGQPTFVVAFIEIHEATDWLCDHHGYVNAKFVVGIESYLRRELDQLALLDLRRKTGSDLIVIKDIDKNSATALFDEIMEKAVLYGATDIHIEPSEKGVLVRYRIDGTLMSAYVLPKDSSGTFANIVLSRCRKNPSEFHKMHDGRFSFKCFDKEMDVRFSQVPLVTGPKIALRILDKVAVPVTLVELGYSDHNLNLISKAIATPHGVILVTGPTGCGKTTTNHSILNELKNISENIMSVEDPVEIRNPGVSQLQISKDQDISFATALRAFLRQDPDIIMVGEIRDQETAEIAIQAAQTGHLLLSTIHTNDPVGAILRLRDFGVARINISSSLIAVISQRLVKKLCPHCKKEAIVSKEKEPSFTAKYLRQPLQRVYFAQGCQRCFGGYKGRTVVAEVLLMNESIRTLIDQDKVSQIQGLLRARDDYKTILHDAQRLVEEGLTSLEEVVKVLG